jgi:hypothetical protein
MGNARVVEQGVSCPERVAYTNIYLNNRKFNKNILKNLRIPIFCRTFAPE